VTSRRADRTCAGQAGAVGAPVYRRERNVDGAEDGAAEQGDEADEAFGGTVTRQKCRLMPAPVNFGRGHRFAAHFRCSTDSGESESPD